MSLIKSKLIQNITEANPHLFVRDVERIVNTIFNEITQSLADGKRVELRGFGTFGVKYRMPKKARNPGTGAPRNLPQRHVPTFKPSKLMRSHVNNSLKK